MPTSAVVCYTPFYMRTFIVPDVHGRFGLLYGLLNTAGIVTSEEEGIEKIDNNVRVVQLGDLANCVSRDRHGDIRCLRLVEKGIIDHYLVGNHEHPYFGGPAFNGFRSIPEVEQPIRKLYWDGKLSAAYSEANILVTHAGLTREWEGTFANAREAEKFLNQNWQHRPTHDVFSAIPYERGGRSRHGGVLWADWMEGKCRDFNQIVGHTPQKTQVPVTRTYRAEGFAGNWSTCIDWGGKLGFNVAGCWINDDGTLDFVYFQRTDVPSLGIFFD